MLHRITEAGQLTWHCSTPTCPYHNCAAWDEGIRCRHHAATQRQQPQGQSLTAHLGDEGVQWVSACEIELPPCPACAAKKITTKTTLRVHDDEELTPPIITRDELSGQIVQVAPHPHPKFSGNLWFVRSDTVRTREPHPMLAHLSSEQIAEMQADIKNKAPDAPVEWMQTESTREMIHEVYQHPAVARHLQLAEQMKAAGKLPPSA